MGEIRISAFPVAMSEGGETRIVQHGMTLRDWFAGEAMCGMVGSGDIAGGACERGAKNAYAMADALLEARK